MSVNKHVMRRRLLVIFVKDCPGSLVGERGVGDTAQATWEGSHQTARPAVVSAVLEDGARHVWVEVAAVLRLELSVEALLDSVALVGVVAVGHTDSPLSTGGLGGQSWPDKNKIKVNNNKIKIIKIRMQ